MDTPGLLCKARRYRAIADAYAVAARALCDALADPRLQPGVERAALADIRAELDAAADAASCTAYLFAEGARR